MSSRIVWVAWGLLAVGAIASPQAKADAPATSEHTNVVAPPQPPEFDYAPFPEIPVATVTQNPFLRVLKETCSKLATNPPQAPTWKIEDRCVDKTGLKADELAAAVAPATTRERVIAVAALSDQPTSFTDKDEDKEALQKCRVGVASIDPLVKEVSDLTVPCAKLRGGKSAPPLDTTDLSLLRALRDDEALRDLLGAWAPAKFAPNELHAAAVSASGQLAGPGVSALGFGDLSDNVIRGLSDFIAQRAKLETLRYVRQRLVDDLCTGVREQFLSHTCTSIKALDKNQPLDGIGSTLKAAAEDDLRQLPDISLAYAESKQPTLAEITFSGRVGVAFFEAVRGGRSAPSVLADLDELGAQPCEANQCRHAATAIRFVSALMYAAQQGGDSWEQTFEQAKPQDFGLYSVALVLLAEKRIDDLYERAHADLPKAFDLALFQQLVSVPGAIWADALRLQKRWKDLKGALHPVEGPVSEADQRRLTVRAIAAVLTDTADLIDHTGTLVLQPEPPELSLATQHMRLLARVSAGVAERQYAAATIALLESLNTMRVGEARAILPPGLSKFVPFLVEVANAEDAQGVSAALESYAAPLGTYQEKYERPMVTINAAVGALGGAELIDSHGVSGASPVLAGFAPVGVHATTPVGCGFSHVGLLLSIIDLGALTTYRFDDELDGKLPQQDADANDMDGEAKADPTPKISFAQIIAPGLFGTFALGGPFLLGAGVSLSPKLREVSDRDTKLTAPAWRFGVFLAADVPIFTLD